MIAENALTGQRHFAAKRNPKRERGKELRNEPRSRFLKLRFWLSHEDFHNPTRKRADVNIDISSLTRRVMKKTQLQSSRFGLRSKSPHPVSAKRLKIAITFKNGAVQLEPIRTQSLEDCQVAIE